MSFDLEKILASKRALPCELNAWPIAQNLPILDALLQAALDCIVACIALKFGVSAELIAKRLKVEKLWPPT